MRSATPRSWRRSCSCSGSRFADAPGSPLPALRGRLLLPLLRRACRLRGHAKAALDLLERRVDELEGQLAMAAIDVGLAGAGGPELLLGDQQRLTRRRQV